MALKIEEARSRGTNGHMARMFKDVVKEVKYPTEENYANEMTIELYWVGPNNGSRDFWLQLKYRHLLQGDRTLSFKKLVDAVSAEFLDRAPPSLGIWDHAGCIILNDEVLEECIDDPSRRGLRDPRWRVCTKDIDASSNGWLCWIYSLQDDFSESNDNGDDSGTMRKANSEEINIETKSGEWRAFRLWTPQNSKIRSGKEVIDIWEQSLQSLRSQKILQNHNEEVKEWLMGLPWLLVSRR